MTALQSRSTVFGPVRADDFRRIAGSFPSGVTVVTTLDEEGTPRGVTVSAFASISLDPPIVLVSLDHRSSTLASILSHGSFAVNVLAHDAVSISQQLSASSDDFQHIDWRPSALADGAPVLGDRLVAHADCVLHDTYRVGDHQLVFGLVVGGHARESEPLVYHRRLYHSLGPITDGRNQVQ